MFLLVLLLIRAALFATLRVNSLANLERRVLQALESLRDLVGVLADDSLVDSRDVTLDLILDVLRDSSGVFLDLLLSVVDILVGLVFEIDHALGSLISLLSSLGLVDHAVDVGVRQTTA